MKEGYRIDPQTRCDFAVYHAQVVAVLCQAIFNRLGCKERQATSLLTDFPENVILLANAVVTSEPLDKLSNRLQHLYTCGRAWQEVIGPQGLIAECQRRLCSLGQPWGEEDVSWQLPMLLHHFLDYMDRVVEDMLRVTTSLGANVWARLTYFLNLWISMFTPCLLS